MLADSQVAAIVVGAFVCVYWALRPAAPVPEPCRCSCEVTAPQLSVDYSGLAAVGVLVVLLVFAAGTVFGGSLTIFFGTRSRVQVSKGKGVWGPAAIQ